MVNKNEMFEGGLVKMDFFLKEEEALNEAADKLAKKEAEEKNAGKVASVVANQKSGSTK